MREEMIRMRMMRITRKRRIRMVDNKRNDDNNNNNDDKDKNNENENKVRRTWDKDVWRDMGNEGR